MAKQLLVDRVRGHVRVRSGDTGDAQAPHEHDRSYSQAAVVHEADVGTSRKLAQTAVQSQARERKSRRKRLQVLEIEKKSLQLKRT